nr:sodium ion-translocating decarboxylase subunit beta [Klebsiella pneumoniae]
MGGQSWWRTSSCSRRRQGSRITVGVIAFCVGDRGRGADGEADERVQPAQNQPADWFRGGVSAVPMAARVSNKVGLEADGQNFLLMHAMGPERGGGGSARRSPPG